MDDPLSSADAARTIALVYEAALGRAADPAGLNFWIGRFEAGHSLAEIAEHFLVSEEFEARVGDAAALSPRALVEALYLNVLERPGDAAGVSFWTGIAADPAIGPADLLLAFATAEENRARAAYPDALVETAPGTWAVAPEASSRASVEDFAGEGQAIVVIDAGFSEAYDQSRTVLAYDFSGAGDDDARVPGYASHGDWVAQTALDAAPDADIVHLKVFPDDAREGGRLVDIEEALRFAAMLAGEREVAAVNLSLGLGNATAPALSPLSDEIAALDALDVVVIAAAGNDGAAHADGVSVIAADPSALAVAAVDADGRLADFSQRSDTLLDTAANGVDVPVRALDGTVLEVSGTSLAAPGIAGIVARLSEASLELLGEDLTRAEAVDVFERSGLPVEGADTVRADGDEALGFFLDNLALYDDALLA